MFYCDGAIAERGSRGRQPSVMNMDINAQYTINLGNHDVVLTANIFNIFDTHTVKETVEQNTGYYGYTTSMQPARAARLGFRYTFN
jgi:outer membrane receptor protein involved in Fe transport